MNKESLVRNLAIRWGGHEHPVFMSYALGIDKNVQQGGN